MSLRERSHASYLQYESKADVAEQKELAVNDNDRPKTAFEATVDQIRKEYSEAESLRTESQQQLIVLENDLKQLWQQLEGMGVATQASAPLVEEYVQLQAERDVLAKTSEELTQKLDKLRLEYEPFQALQEGLVNYHASTQESMRLRAREDELHTQAEGLRQAWAAHEKRAHDESEKIDREDAFVAGTQRLLVEEVETLIQEQSKYATQREAVKDPRYATIPEYQQWIQFFKQADDWLAYKKGELENVRSQRQKLQDHRNALKSDGKEILRKYDACMEEQLRIAEQMPVLEQASRAATTAYQYGVAGAGEVMRRRGTLVEQPVWVSGGQQNKDNPDSFVQAA